MFGVRLTLEDGSSRTHPLVGPTLSIGRDASNDIILAGPDVSTHHCRIERTPSGFTITDRGSRNGTWLNNGPLTGTAPFTPHDRVYIGKALLELVVQAAEVRTPAFGRIVRPPPPDREMRAYAARLHRYAEDWDRHDRRSAFALRKQELHRARTWLADPQHHDEVARLDREFIAASTRVQRTRRVRALALTIVGATSLVIASIFGASRLSPDEAPESAPVVPPPDPSAVTVEHPRLLAPDELDPPGPARPTPDEAILHRVVPLETLDDIARRYGVTTNDIIDWNLLNPSDPRIADATLTIRQPQRRPLPRQLIHHTVEPGETWTRLAKRFGVPATRLQAYNRATELEPGATIDVWIDPRPYVPRVPVKPIPRFEADRRAVSIGKPNDGRLEQGIALPRSDLYLRRSPQFMWGSSYTVTRLQTAIATFRRDVDYEGELIIGDISRRHGGPFDPHKSHQAGRDVDIWLPTITGVYHTKFVQSGDRRPRRPSRDEVDWYATWGLVRALIQTGAVLTIFLDYRYHKYVYDAAVNMNATPEQLAEWIQYPKPPGWSGGILHHADDHLSHIHVRFKCAPWELECSGATGAFVE